jgi:hypothetical protein
VECGFFQEHRIVVVGDGKDFQVNSSQVQWVCGGMCYPGMAGKDINDSVALYQVLTGWGGLSQEQLFLGIASHLAS